jgi:hypothetical protein
MNLYTVSYRSIHRSYINTHNINDTHCLHRYEQKGLYREEII